MKLVILQRMHDGQHPEEVSHLEEIAGHIFRVYENPPKPGENPGGIISDSEFFSEEFNQRLRGYAREGACILFLNRGFTVSISEVREMQLALEADPMIGISTPFLTFPSISGAGRELPPRLVTRDWHHRGADFLQRLPPTYFIPYAESRIILIKSTVVNDFKFHTRELMDFVPDVSLSMADAGYSNVVAFRARIGYPAGGEINDFRTLTVKKDEILKSREELFRTSINWKFVSLCLGAAAHERISIMLDMSHVDPVYNGTSILALQVLDLLTEMNSYDLTIYSSPTALDFFNLRRFEAKNVRCVTAPLDEHHVYHIGFKLGQLWYKREFLCLSKSCLNIAFLVFDTIAWDVATLREIAPQIDGLWNGMARNAAGLLFISKFSEDRFKFRFQVPNQVVSRVALLSTDSADYEPENTAAPTAVGGAYLLIFGNNYVHKFIQPTVESIAPILKNFRIKVVGNYNGVHDRNIDILKSGKRDKTEINELIRNCSAFIFPSHYEGFGLPIVEALAQGKLVFCRDNELNREIADSWHGPGRFCFYADTDDLVEKIRIFDAGGDISDTINGIRDGAASNTWKIFAGRMSEFFESIMQIQDPRDIVLSRLLFEEAMQETSRVQEAQIVDSILGGVKRRGVKWSIRIWLIFTSVMFRNIIKKILGRFS